MPFTLFTTFPLAQYFILSCTFPLCTCPFFNLLLFVLSLILSSHCHSFLPSAVKSRQFSSKLELWCLYSEGSQIQSVKWTYRDKSRKLHLVSPRPGSIVAVLPRPISSETAGNYTCTLRLSNGQTVWATETVALQGKRTLSLSLLCVLASSSQQFVIIRQTRQTSFQLSRDNDP